MINEEKFINSVWTKYDNYLNNSLNDTFFKRNQYKNIVYIQSASLILSVFIFIISSIGIVYAGYSIVEKIWKQPIKYSSYEEKINSEIKNEILSENELEKILSEDYIMEKSILFLNQIGYNNIDNLFIEHKRSYAKDCDIYYQIKNTTNYSSGIELHFNAINGEFMGFIDRDIDSNYNVMVDDISEETAINIADNIYNNLNLEKKYKLKEISEREDSMSNLFRQSWVARFCLDCDGILNDYDYIEITFYIEKNTTRICQILIYNEGYDYINNELLISKNQAKEIALQIDRKIANLDIVDIDVNLDIKPINEFIYLQKKTYGTDDGIVVEESKEGNNIIYNQYLNEKILRKVWNVKIKYADIYENKEQVRNWKEQFGRHYYVDASTGEIIGGMWGESLYE